MSLVCIYVCNLSDTCIFIQIFHCSMTKTQVHCHVKMFITVTALVLYIPESEGSFRDPGEDGHRSEGPGAGAKEE